MIARDMPVQIRRCGTTVPVQSLSIGDLVYDPVCDNYVEIVDILSRETTQDSNRLVRLASGRLGGGTPRLDVVISRSQPVAFVKRLGEGRPGQLGFGAAHQLGEEHRVNTVLFAIFPERPGCISVGGLILRLIAPSAFDQVPARIGGGRA